MHNSDVRRHGVRLRRTGELPAGISEELNGENEYPHVVRIELGGHATVLRFRRPRKQPVDMFGGYDGVDTRELFCWIESPNGQRLAAIHFVEWHVLPLLDNDAFVEEMDTYSMESYTFAETMTAVWDIEDVAVFGALVEFRRAWQAPDAPLGLWHRAADYFIRRFYGRRRAAVLILKAFPLEYEGSEMEKNGLEEGFASRSQAMTRHYRRCLSVTPFPGRLGKEGWMWRRLNDAAPEPRARRGR